jgi:FkbM family methyltransferase
MNNLGDYAGIFDSITPWCGKIPAGFTVDFMGNLTSKQFLPWGYHPAYVDGADLLMERPRLGNRENGEFWFEATNWVLAAREARERFVMITLGALFGYQAVGSYRALQLFNPMPCKLVAVEPIPENIGWIKRHMRDNGIDPDDHWVLQAAISDRNEPAFFPVGSPGVGAHNCVSLNSALARQQFLHEVISRGCSEDVLRNLIMRDSTGLEKEIIEGKKFMGEIRLVSCVTLRDVLGPFDRVDFVEADIQESEIVVFPPFRDLLKRKVRRIHIGTHGALTHRSLHQMFADDGWEVVFSYEPDSTHESVLGTFSLNDGILTVVNPML